MNQQQPAENSNGKPLVRSATIPIVLSAVVLGVLGYFFLPMLMEQAFILQDKMNSKPTAPEIELPEGDFLNKAAGVSASMGSGKGDKAKEDEAKEDEAKESESKKEDSGDSEKTEGGSE